MNGLTLSDILQEACKLVQAEPWFRRHRYDAVPQDTGDLDGTLRSKLFEAGDGALILFTVEGFAPGTSASARVDGVAELVAMVSENAPMNRSRAPWAPAFAVAEFLAAHLNLKLIGGAPLSSPSIQFRPAAGLLSYRVSLKLPHVLQGVPKS